MSEQIPLVAVVGPTASGKTRLAIELCKTLGGEVVSGDSMQLYKRLSIATAKPTPEEQSKVPHHLIDLIEPWEEFSVAQYTALAHGAIADIRARGKLPVVAGGTGLYIRSLLQNLVFTEQQRDEAYRQNLAQLAESEGNEAVHKLLCEVDPQSAAAIHPNNLGRVIRALEVFHLTGSTMTEQQQLARSQPSPYHACIVGVGYRDRELLADRINQRVELMVRDGLVEEVAALQHSKLSATASQAIGYKELLPYLAGETTLEWAVADIQQRTRQYAKRQMTWFKREADIRWFWQEDYGSPDELSLAAAHYAAQTLGLNL